MSSKKRAPPQPMATMPLRNRPSAMPRLPLAAALALFLAGCGNERVDAPGAVTPGEAEALDDAASMLDERRLPPEALPSDGPAKASPPAEMTGDAAPARQ